VGQDFCKVKIRYTKGEEIKFISHLDHMRVLERALRRAELPIAYSQGFNPRPKIAYLTRALKVGETSEACEAELTFEGWIKPDIVKTALNQVFPSGFAILDASFNL
jgi:radical SAM-linked protein